MSVYCRIQPYVLCWERQVLCTIITSHHIQISMQIYTKCVYRAVCRQSAFRGGTLWPCTCVATQICRYLRTPAIYEWSVHADCWRLYAAPVTLREKIQLYSTLRGHLQPLYNISNIQRGYIRYSSASFKAGEWKAILGCSFPWYFSHYSSVLAVVIKCSFPWPQTGRRRCLKVGLCFYICTGHVQNTQRAKCYFTVLFILLLTH